jgi:hypothetical protein
MSKRFRIPSLKGIGDGPPGHFVAGTVLREFAKAISELVDASETSGTPVAIRNLEPEIKAAAKLFQQRAAWVRGSASDDLCRLNATLLLDAMLAQEKWGRRLARLVAGGAP